MKKQGRESGFRLDKLVVVAALMFVGAADVIADESKIGYAELSTNGIRAGLFRNSWAFFVRLNANFQGTVESSIDKENDSVTYSGEGSAAWSNMEVGIGFDKEILSSPMYFGIRNDVFYNYPYSTGARVYKYTNRFGLGYYGAFIGIFEYEQVSVGGSVGPIIKWKFTHDISDYKDSSGTTHEWNHRSNTTTVDLESEIFVRYNF